MLLDLAILALLVLLTRLPFVSQLLYHWDSAQFGLALENYNVAIHQPHPPGYILYVGLAKLIHWWLPDANLVYVIISIGFSIGAVLALYLLGRSMFSRPAGGLAAVLFVFSPLFWGYGEVACAYTAETFFSVLVAYLAWLAWVRARSAPFIKVFLPITWQQVLLTVILGLAGGFRQGLVVFLLPLWLLVLWPAGWRAVLGCGLILIVTCLAWFLPQAYLSGGQGAYLGESLNQWTQIIWAFSFFNYGYEGLKLNLLIFISYTLFALGFALALFIGLGWLGIRQGRSFSRQRAWFLVLWVLPAIIFYLLIHMRQPGYVLTYLPAFYLAIGYFLAWLGDLLPPGWRRPALIGLVALIAAGNLWLFIAWPAIPSSYGFVRRQEKELNAKFEYVAENYPPETTLILGGDYFRHIMYYLPQYQVLWLGPLHRRPEEMNFYQKIISARDKKISFLWPTADRLGGTYTAKKVSLSLNLPVNKLVIFDEKMMAYCQNNAWNEIDLAPAPSRLYVLNIGDQPGHLIIAYHNLFYVR